MIVIMKHITLNIFFQVLPHHSNLTFDGIADIV
jgi:hypothetical protein